MDICKIQALQNRIYELEHMNQRLKYDLEHRQAIIYVLFVIIATLALIILL